MNRAVEILKILATMSNHWTRKRGPGFLRYFNGAGNEKLVVWCHRNKRPTFNPPSQGQGMAGAQRPTFNLLA